MVQGVGGGPPEVGGGRVGGLGEWRVSRGGWRMRSAAADGEIGEGSFGHGFDGDIRDDRIGGTLAAPVDESLEGILGAGGEGFDVAVHRVSDPTGEGEVEGCVAGACAVVDSLDFSFYDEMNGGHPGFGFDLR